MSHKNGVRPSSAPGFEDVDRLENSDGIVAVISQRSFDGALTMALFREFDRDGRRCRTAFMTENLFESFLEMFNRGARRLQELKRTGALPFPVQGRVRR